MTDFEQLLLMEQKNPNALVLQFINSEYDETDVVAFVEGVFDPIFYYDLISSAVPQRKIRFFECGGKKSVLGVKEFLKFYSLSVQPHKVLYLCDCDFDIVLRKKYDGIFVTDFYSIESYFADVNYVDYLINKFCSTTIRKGVKAELLARIDETMKAYCQQLIVPMAFLCYIRERDHSADFDKLSAADLLDFQNSAIKSCKKEMRLEKILSRIETSVHPIDLSIVRNYAKIMKKLDHKIWMRGKFALQLLKICIRRSGSGLHSSIKAALNALCNYIGSNALIQSKTFLGQLQSLDSYIAAV